MEAPGHVPSVPSPKSGTDHSPLNHCRRSSIFLKRCKSVSVAGRIAQRTKSRQERGFPEANTSQTWPRFSLYYSKYPRDLCCGCHCKS